MPKFEKGNFYKEQDRNGWIYGNFMPEGLHRDDRVEIKLTKLPKSYSNKPHYQKTATKLDIIWKGRAIWEISGEEVELNDGDYVIIPPKVRTAIKDVLSSELIVQTIKIPSTPEDKVVK